MGHEEESLLFPSSFAFISAESFVEAADASGSGECFFTYFLGSRRHRLILRGCGWQKDERYKELTAMHLCSRFGFSRGR
jgi:hypothetical protein